MYLTKWDPFEKLSNLEEDLNFFLDYPRWKKKKLGSADSSWLPAVDIHEDPENYYFDVEIPGIEKNKLDVHVEDSILNIKGEKKSSSEEKGENYHRIEREYGSFMRSFTLPETADGSKINADYKDGVLKIKIAKKEASKPKRIEVKVA